MELLDLAPETQNLHCPFNTAHTMPRKTFIKHLNRCPDKPPHFKHCIYNKSHVMPEADLKNHEENCPNRISMDVAIYETEDIMTRPDTDVQNTPSIKYEESWDGLEQTTGILQTIKTKTTSMKAIHNTTRSERKEHRANLHKNDINNVENKDGKKQQNKKMDTKSLFFGKNNT
eukprot:XP_003240166.1 PREDICTED: gametocyte-specific factor 1 homolog [Acyrthosiphon pisum]